MKNIRLSTLIIVLIFLGCTLKKESNDSTVRQADSITTVISNNKVEIQKLIRQVLNWSDSENSIDLLPVLTDIKDSVYIGFDLDKHKANLEKLRKTNFFTNEFIENYNNIILTLDKRIRNKELEEWVVGDLPVFAFANDVNPWTFCQDIPYDTPNPFDLIEVETIKLDSVKGELNWKWGKLKINNDIEWKEFRYKFRVVKENGQWKIDYLQGFDYKQSA